MANDQERAAFEAWWLDASTHKAGVYDSVNAWTAWQARAALAAAPVRELCAAAYQVVGAADGPVEMLDNLLAVADGKPLPHAPGAGLPWHSAMPVQAVPDGKRMVLVEAYAECGKHTDDNPGLRHDCAKKLEAGKPCEKCPSRAVSAAPAAPQVPAVPDGYKLMAVKGFDELMTALNRAESKGYLPDAVAEHWSAFDWRASPSAAPQPAERVPLRDEQIAEISVSCALVTPSDIYFARAIERAHGIKPPNARLSGPDGAAG